MDGPSVGARCVAGRYTRGLCAREDVSRQVTTASHTRPAGSWPQPMTRTPKLAFSISAVERFVEHSDDVRVPTPRQYHEELGARLKLVAVFDDEERRVPIHLGKEDPTA